jgi:hypothetical protein
VACAGRDDAATSPDPGWVDDTVPYPFRHLAVTRFSVTLGTGRQPIMSTPREKIYRCTLLTTTSRVTGHVRAWDDRAALQLFREELVRSGVKARGRVLLKNLAGGKEHPFELVAS